jgi:hypothetical protein
MRGAHNSDLYACPSQMHKPHQLTMLISLQP